MRLLRSKRGIGTVVASIMFLIISILFIGGTFLWQSTNQSHMNALDKDRMDERVSIQATWDSTTHNVAIKVSNIGTIDLEIIRLWILDKDHTHGNSHLCIDISYNLAVGGHTSIAKSKIEALITLFNDPEENPDYPFEVTDTTYFFKVVTARGNIANTLLVPHSALGSQWPAVIIPGSSYVEKKHGGGGGAYIHLEVYNSLDEDIIIKMIVATRYGGEDPGGGAEQSEIITVEPLWPLISGDITVRDFEGIINSVYTAEIVLIELINIVGLVVSSYYFTVQ